MSYIIRVRDRRQNKRNTLWTRVVLSNGTTSEDAQKAAVFDGCYDAEEMVKALRVQCPLLETKIVHRPRKNRS